MVIQYDTSMHKQKKLPQYYQQPGTPILLSKNLVFTLTLKRLVSQQRAINPLQRSMERTLMKWKSFNIRVILCTNIFKIHVKKYIKFNLSNFFHIWPFLTSKTAKVYTCAMIFLHINCFTTWIKESTFTFITCFSLGRQLQTN